MDRSSMPPPSASKKGAPLPDVHEELERSESNRSVNFSRPRGPNSPMSSPPASPTIDRQFTHGTGAWYSEPVHSQKGGTGSGQQADVLAAKLARIQAASGQETSRSNHGTSAQGTHLSKVGQPGVTGTAVNAPPSKPQQQEMETIMVYDASSRTFVPTLKPKVKPLAPAPARAPAAAALPPKPAPGQYDPNTRTIVPLAQTTTPLGTAKPARPTLNTDLEPPPRNPARLSPTSSPRTSQLIQPEDAPTRMIQTSVGPAVSYNATKTKRSSSLDVPSRDSPSVKGRKSPSPSRKTHFSASPVIEAARHDPPPRDISPAKSAMKYSPASSVRASSPLAHFAGHSKSPSSETSETPSLSSDGYPGKKKKIVRVSFDEQPHVTEVKPVRSVLAESDDEDFSKPRPALPSFGSVRRDRVVAEKVTEMAPERHDHSNDHAVGGILRNASDTSKPTDEPLPPEVTSKEVSGYASDNSDDSIDRTGLSQPTETITAPAAVATTSDDVQNSDAAGPVVKDFASANTSDQHLSSDVPMINLSPPTPGTEDIKTFDHNVRPVNRQSAEINVPGQWGAEQEGEPSTPAPPDALNNGPKIAPVMVHSPEESSVMLDPITEYTDSDDDSAEFSDAAEDPSELEGGFASLDAIAVSPINANTSPASKSYAATTSPPESPIVAKTFKATPSADAAATTTDGDWTQATAYWSQLSRQQREQIEREHFSSDDETRPAPAAVRKKKTQRSTPSAAAAAPIIPKSSPSHREAQPAQPAMKKSMRPQPESTTAEPARAMRTSMRNSGFSSGSLRGSRKQASAEPQGALQKKTLRPQSSGSLSAPSASAALTNNRDSRVSPKPNTSRPVSSVPTAPVISRQLQKELAHDSDSESSFKKKRRSAAPTADGSRRYSMARSMRGGPSAAPEERPVSPTPPRGRGRDSFSIRSLSPTGSLFGRKKQKDVRDSIRNAPVDGGKRTTLRNSQPPAKAAARQTPAPPKTSRFKSRFADSDDSDDDAAPPPRRDGGFRSRFADSDDDSDVELAPVRGIPRRAGQNDGDSTDLDDSEDDRRMAGRSRQKQKMPIVPDPADIDKAMDAARKKLGMTNGPSTTTQSGQHNDTQGSALSKGSLRNASEDISPEPKSMVGDPALSPHAKKRGFMGSILRRNRNSQQSIMTVGSMAPASPAHQRTPLSPVTKAPSSRPQSPASPGKLVRRASGQPQTRQRMQRGDSSLSTATAPPTVGESSWPLSDAPPVPAIPANVDEVKADGRPATSDGSPVVRFSEDAGNKATYSSRTGKKKKFGLLRRAFGLND